MRLSIISILTIALIGLTSIQTVGEMCIRDRSPEIYIRVVGTEDISNIRLMRDGCSVKEWDNLGCSAAIKYIDESLTNDLMKMPHYYYAVIAYANDEMAWSSPVFLG